MSVFHNNMLVGASQPSGVTFNPNLIPNSVWFDGSADFLNRQNGSEFANRKEVTLSYWVFRNGFGQQAIMGSVESANGFIIGFNSSDAFELHLDGTANLVSNALFRDVGWYHILVSIDTSQNVSTHRSRVFINGEAITSFSASAFPSQNSNIPGISGEQTSTEVMRIGVYNNAVSNFRFWNGYIAQACMIESKSIQQGDFAVSDFLDTFTFGTNGSQVIPKANADIAALASAAGGNSFCLDFADSSNLGNDISDNSPSGENDFSVTSMDSSNHSTHTPSKVYPKVSNIGTPSGDTAANYTMTSGSNRMVYSGSNQTYKGLISTQIIQPDDPAIYWEMYLESGSVSGDGGRVAVGLAAPDFNAGNGSGFVGAGGNNPSIARTTISDNGNVGSVASKVLAGGVQNLAYEPSTGKIWFGVDGTWNNGSATASTTLNLSSHDHQTTPQDFVFFLAAARSTDIGVLNFGDNPTFSGNETAGTNADANGHGLFKYAVPSGFLAPVSANLTAPTYQGIDYFNSTLYEGTGSSGPSRVGDFVPYTDVYTVDNSAIFEHDDKRYLSFTPDSGGNQKTFTISFWFKLTGQKDTSNLNAVISTDDGSKQFQIRFSDFNTGGLSGGEFDQVLSTNAYNGSSFVLNLGVDQKFGPSSTWTNAVFAYDTRTGVSSADKVKIYIDGVQAATSGTQLSTDDYDTTFNGNQEHQIGRQTNNAVGEPDIYLAEFVLVVGQQLGPDSFCQIDT